MNFTFNSIESIVAIVISIVAIVISIVVTRWYFKEKKPLYSIRSVNIIKNIFDDFDLLELSYSGKKIENFTVSKIVFWNGGRETIHRKDIVSSEPLIVKAKEGTNILNAKIIYSRDPANEFTLTKHQSQLKLDFDYIDKGHGIIIQLIHTGLSSADIEIKGKIKGAGPLKMKFITQNSPKFWNLSIRTSQYIYGMLPVFFSLIYLYISFIVSTNIILSIIIGFLSMAMFLLGCFIIKNRIPKGFDAFYDEF